MDFQTIGLFARNDDDNIQRVLQQVIDVLQTLGCEVCLAKTAIKKGYKYQVPTLNNHQIGKKCKLLIVVGGDGSLLHVAREMNSYQLPILGVNRGRVGFLTDINPRTLALELQQILANKYLLETRRMLKVTVLNAKNNIVFQSHALNDIVLYNSNVSRMLEFEVIIDKNYVMHQRADGIIIATPTGSTAYSMSGGGPIVHPKLEVFTLLPMFAHTLSSRPMVISSNSVIEIKLAKTEQMNPMVSCDGQIHTPLDESSTIILEKADNDLQLIHPIDYNFFQTLREKLGWSLNPSSDRFYND